LAIACLFREPDRINGGGGSTSEKKDTKSSKVGNGSNGVSGMYVDTGYGSASSLKELEDEDEENAWLLESDDGKPHVKPGKSLWGQVLTIYRLIFDNAALPITLYLFAFIELVDEVLISSCSMVVHRYFGWSGSTAGFLIASLGSLVLPADFIVERMSHVHSERKIMKVSEQCQRQSLRHPVSSDHLTIFHETFLIKYSLVFLSVCMFGILNYEGLIMDLIGTVEGEEASIGDAEIKSYLNKKGEFYYDWRVGRYVYMFFLSAIFMGTIVLEGVDTSLMSRVTPPSLNDTFINCGLLATLIGTVGRVSGDSIITIGALVDKNVFTDFVNATFFFLIPLTLIGYVLVIRYYKHFL